MIIMCLYGSVCKYHLAHHLDPITMSSDEMPSEACLCLYHASCVNVCIQVRLICKATLTYHAASLILIYSGTPFERPLTRGQPH